MVFFILCAGAVIMVGFGLFMLLAPDTMWRITQWQNRMAGLEGKRNKSFDTMNRFFGVVVVLFGIGFGVVGVLMATGSIR